MDAGSCLSRDGGANKVRVDINMTAETKRLLDDIIDHELEQDRKNDRPARSKSEILEMVVRKGCRLWQQESSPGVQ
jgi:hypothetical protein